MIDEKTKIVKDYWYSYYEDDSLLQSSVLYSSTLDVAPDYSYDSTVERVANLDHCIDKVDLETFESKRMDGRKVWQVAYERHIHVGNREGTLSFDVVREGKSWGKTDVVYDHKAAMFGE